MKTILITGVPAVVSKATARLFKARGWKVIATKRSPDKESEYS